MFKKSQIAVLDAKTANRIAAGEVVERPASVIKELLENSIDAGATSIDLEIEEGGLKRIQVSDNGCGMDTKDARLAFVRHATSKIKKAEDLEAIYSMGFRGEALASIGAVSRVTMRTRPAELLGGTMVEIEGGKILRVEPTGCPEGTSICVEDLFFNTPARLKYMKTASAEATQITEVAHKLALACPQIRIRLFNQGKLVFSSGEAGLLANIAAVYGVKTASQMLPLSIELGDIKIAGYCGKPSLSRGIKRNLDIFVNNRYIKSPVLMAAIIDAYKTVLSPGRFPVAVIKITLPADSIDINIHPAKTEIKILEERTVFDLLRSAVRQALFSPEIIPAEKTAVPVAAPVQETESKREILKPESRPELPPLKTLEIPAATPQVSPKNSLKAKPSLPLPAPAKTLFPSKAEPPKKFPELLYKGFLPPTYLLWQGVEGLYIMDQHAAHEKVLYEKLIRTWQEQKGVSQILLIPVNLRLSPTEIELWQTHQALLQDLGFEIEEFRKPNYLIRGIPADLPSGGEVDLVRDLLEKLALHSGSWNQEAWHWAAASAAACGAAIKSGTFCSEQEAGALLRQLEQSENPYTCPHGRPTLICLTPKELAARFKRS